MVEPAVAVPTGVSPPPPRGPDAAAILFLLLGDADGAALVSRLSPDEVRRLAGAIYGMEDADADLIDGAITSFVGSVASGSGLTLKAHDRIASALDTAFGPPIANALLAPLTPPAAQPGLERLCFLDANALHARLHDEHPQVIALICAHSDPAIASAVIAQLPEAEQDDVLFRLATLEPVTADALAEAERLILAKADTAASGPQSQRGGASDVAAILNLLGKGADKRALKALQRRDRVLAQAVEDEMLTFADLAQLDDRALGTLLRSVDTAALVPALRGADVRLRARCLGCMSSRAAQTIEDELAEGAPVSLADVQAAQRSVVAIARRLADEGAIQMGRDAGDYV